jgi:hypothetical protein
MLVWHPVWLVTADVDIRAREDGRDTGQHLADDLAGRRQFRVKPDRLVPVAGRQLGLDPVSPAVKLRIQLHQCGRMARRIDLRNDGDEAVRGAFDERPQILHGLEGRAAIGRGRRPAHR